jgi:Zn-finger nucleic acid-binding protein
MLCPIDGETLVMTERSGVEIDYCPKCRGVWLDRGELDKIIERSAAPQTPGAAPFTMAQPQRQRRHDDDDDDNDDRQGRKRRGGLLGNLFDF